jgi:hypothetical protein
VGIDGMKTRRDASMGDIHSYVSDKTALAYGVDVDIGVEFNQNELV